MSIDKDLTKNLNPLFTEVKGLTAALNRASDNLSNVGVDKLRDSIKDLLKTTKLFDSEFLDSVETLRDLNVALERIEDSYNAIKKHESAARIIAERQLESVKDSLIKQDKYNEALEQGIRKEAEKLIMEDKVLNLSSKQAELIKQQYPTLKREIDARERQIASTDKVTKAHEGLTKSIGENINKFFSLSMAMVFLKKAAFETYDQLNRLTERGMLGAFATVNMTAATLRLTAKEFEDLINKNREIVNQLGGGIKGIERFAAEVKLVQGELKYLGKAAPQAASRFIEMSKKAGLTPKDGMVYRKNLDQSIRQFKEFSALFGDSYEEYASLIESINDEEQIRSRLNGMSRSGVGLYQQELRTRVANLKIMGLQNDQITEVNKSLGRLVNPEENDQVKRAQESVSANAAFDETLRVLQVMGRQQEADRMLASRETFREITTLLRSGMHDEAVSLLQSTRGIEATKALEQGISASNQTNGLGNEAQYIRATRNTWLSGNEMLKNIRDQGKAALGAEARGAMINVEDRDRIKAASNELLAEHSLTAKALGELTNAIQIVKSLLENPFVNATMAATAALGALAITAGVKGLFGIFGKLGGVVKGAASIFSKGVFGAARSLGGLTGILLKGGKLLKGLLLGGPIGLAIQAGALGLDWGLGKLGVGAGEEPSKEVDDNNWERMTWDEKLMSGVVRGIESAGDFMGIDNIARAVKQFRVANETVYLDKQGRPSRGSVIKDAENVPTDKLVPSPTKSSVQPTPPPLSPQTPQISAPPQMPGMAISTGRSLNQKVSGNYDFDKYAQVLGYRESRNRYHVVNSIGFAGKYQFGAAALEDIGLLKPGTSKIGNRAMKNPNNWTTPGGLDGFLANPQLQEDALRRYTNLQYKRLSSSKFGVINENTSPADVAGYLAAAHLTGVGGALKLKNGQTAKDANKVTNAEYFRLGSGSQTGSMVVNQKTQRDTMEQAKQRLDGLSVENGKIDALKYAQSMPPTGISTMASQRTEMDLQSYLSLLNREQLEKLPINMQRYAIGGMSSVVKVSNPNLTTPQQTIIDPSRQQPPQPSTPSSIDSQAPMIDELKRQTDLLGQIVGNTVPQRSRVTARDDSYLQNQGLVLSGMSG